MWTKEDGKWVIWTKRDEFWLRFYGCMTVLSILGPIALIIVGVILETR